MALDIAGALIAGRQEYHVSASHFAERYQLFVIIALGESIVAIGGRHQGLERDLAYALAAAVTFAGAALLWWAYFDFAAIGGERALHPGAGNGAASWPATSTRSALPDDGRHHPVRRRRQEDGGPPRRRARHRGALRSRGRARAVHAGFVGLRWRAIGA